MSLSREQYNKIMGVYQERRIRNERIRREREREVYEKIPALKEIDECIGALGVRKAKDIIAGKSADASEYMTELEDMKEQKRVLLQSAGFAPDYLDMPYDCMYCKDTGYIGTEKCRCFKKMQLKLLYERSGIENILKKQNFDTFKLDIFDDKAVIRGQDMTVRAYMESVYRFCLKFTERFGDEHGSILFTGPPGVGKTFLANCISERLIKNGHSVIYMTSAELFSLMARADFGGGEEDDEENRDLLFDCELLVIDDLGTEMQSKFTGAGLFSLLNSRMIRSASTVISTNLNLQGIRDLYGDRIVSRIMSEYTVIPIYGKDIRLRGGKNGD